MIAVLDGRSSTDNVLIRTMCLVKQTLNARPLTSVSDNPDDLEALTLGRAKAATPFLTAGSQRYINLRRVCRVLQAYSDII